MESEVNNHVGLPGASDTGYAISLGLRATTDASKINLQLYTETLVPKAWDSHEAPGTTGQGGFDFDLDRTLFSSWTHVAITFDTGKLSLYINGTLLKEHTLSPVAPIAETGGLIIGGHRGGTGRNFDGMIDEVAIWNRVLSGVEITSLYNSGTPPVIPTEVSILDTDNDAMPDWWEHIHGLNGLDPGDAHLDIDNDGFDEVQEFGFGTNPNHFSLPLPYRSQIMELGESTYLSIIYQRDPAAFDFLTMQVERSSDLGITDAWDITDTVVHSVTDLPNGLEEITERSNLPLSDQVPQFLRIRFLEK